MSTALPAQTPTATELAEWVRDTRQRVIELVDDLDDAQLIPPRMSIVNPLNWEMGHLTWFQEIFVLRRQLGEPLILDYADALWDSAAVPHDTRWFLTIPPRPQLLAYMREVADRVADRVTAAGTTDVLQYITRYSVHHEDWHTEALTYTRQTLGYPAPVLPGLSDAPPLTPGDGPLPGDAAIPGGSFLIGALRSDPFAFDNAKWAHPVQMKSFKMARAAVTQAEFAAFVDDGGYRRPELWGDDGWAWRTEAGAEHPVYWRRQGSGWQRRHFDVWDALEPDRPVIHVNYHEAGAYAHWAGRRLPTEQEWEVAATGELGPDGTLSSYKRRFPWGDSPIEPQVANLDWRQMGTVDVGAYSEGDSAFGVRQVMGNMWEWTSSPFAAYPGFERDAYKENSEPFFGVSHRVLRGGSWATRGRLVQGTTRNYFTPERRDVFAGFRTVALE